MSLSGKWHNYWILFQQSGLLQTMASAFSKNIFNGTIILAVRTLKQFLLSHVSLAVSALFLSTLVSESPQTDFLSSLCA